MALRVPRSIAGRERFKTRVMNALRQTQEMVSGRKFRGGSVDSDLVFLADKFRAAPRMDVAEMDADVVTNYLDYRGVMTSRANADVLMLISAKSRRIEPWMWMQPVWGGLLPAGIVGFDLAECREINPYGLPLSVLYGGAGSDASNVLLATNGTKVIMVNLPNSYHLLPEKVSQWDSIPPGEPCKFHYGYTVSTQHRMRDYAQMFVGELKAMGVEKDDVVRVRKIDVGEVTGAEIVFRWRHPSQKKKVERTFTLLNEDMTNFGKWGEGAVGILGGGIDVYFERAASRMPKSHDRYLLSVARSVTNDGYLVLDDPMNYTDTPDTHLERGLFSKPYTTGWMDWWERFIPRTTPYGWRQELRRKLT